MQQTGYSSIINVIVDLQTRGYSFDFSLVGNKLLCAQQKCFLRDEEFDILEMHHFMVEDHGRKETVIYGIESIQHGIKGILLNTIRENRIALPAIIQKKMRKFWI